jgi:hypothetical protein
MEIERLSSANRAAWDALVAEAPGADLFHLADWILDLEVGRMGGLDRSFLVREGGRVLAVVPAVVQRYGHGPLAVRSLASLGLRPAGPCLAAGVPEEAARRALAAAYERLHALADEENLDHLQVALPAGARHDDPPPAAFDLEDRSAGAVLVDLSRGEEDAWNGMEVRCRNTIRKAEKAGIVVEEIPPAGSVDLFHALHAGSYARSGASAVPLAFFRDLFARPWVRLFVARSGGAAVSAVVTGRFRDRSRYWFAGSTDEARRTGANTLALWAAIRAEAAAGVRLFDIGEIRPGSPLPKVQALNRFKRQFGGETAVVPRGHRVRRPVRWALWDLYCALRGAPAW